MIIRPQQGSLFFITQPDHAAAAAVIAEHAIFVYSGNLDKPDWQPFFKDLEDRRTKLLATCSLPLETLTLDYPLVGVADLLWLGAPVEFLTGVARGGSAA